MFKKFLIFSFMMLLLCHDIHAQDLLTTGARPLGMGGAFTSVADDANAVFWNAAGLARLHRGELSASYAKLWEAGIENANLILVYPITGKLALGLGANWIDLNEESEELDFRQIVVNGALGYQLFPFLAFGVTAKYVNFDTKLLSPVGEKLFGEHATGFGLDGALLFSWPSENAGKQDEDTGSFVRLRDFRVGLVLRDISGTGVTFDSGVDDEIFPMRFRAGLSWMPEQKRIFGQTVIPIVAFEANPKERWHLGGELSWLTSEGIMLTTRAGLQKDLHTGDGLTYSFGVGVRTYFGDQALQVNGAHIDAPSLPTPFASSSRYGASILFDWRRRVTVDTVAQTEPIIYPSLIEYYEREGIGEITLTNNRNETIDGDLIVRSSSNLFVRSTIPKTIKPKETVTWTVTPEFNSAYVLQSKEDSLRYSIIYSYRFQDGSPDIVEKEMTVKLAPASAIIWDDYTKAAAFITPDDSTIINFVKGLKSHDVAKGHQFPNIYIAMQLFDALRARGIKYKRDGLDSHHDRDSEGKPFPRDNITYPSVLLADTSRADSLKGDCDDLTVLYCSLLQNASIETALVDWPQHIFMMFDSGIPSNVDLYPFEASMMIDRDGRFWVPVEITSLDSNFVNAWAQGNRHFRSIDYDKRRYKVRDVSKATLNYPPASFQNPNTTLLKLSSKEVDSTRTLFEVDKTLLDSLRIKFVADRTGLTVADAEKENKLNEFGLAHVGLGNYDMADSAFVRISPRNAKALNNLANLFFMLDKFEPALTNYELALAIEDTTWGIHWNLAQLYLEMSDPTKGFSESQQYEKEYRDHLQIALNRLDVSQLLNIPLTDSTVAKGELSLISWLRRKLEGEPSTEVTWLLPYLGFNDSTDFTFRVTIDKEGVDPFDEKGLYVRADQRESGTSESAYFKKEPAGNLRINVTPVNSGRDRKKYRIKVENKSDDIVFDNVIVKWIKKPGLSIYSSSLYYQENRISEAESGETVFGVETGYYLFWYK